MSRWLPQPRSAPPGYAAAPARITVVLLAFLAVVGAAAFLGSRFEPGSWYAGLEKAPWTPPSWVFAPAWTVLYVAMAVAGWLVWLSRERSRALLALWAVQLALNAAWSWLFFGRHSTGLALFDIALLVLAAGLFAALARATQPLASALFVPYLLWLLYAASLNAYVWLRNPSVASS